MALGNRGIVVSFAYSVDAGQTPSYNEGEAFETAGHGAVHEGARVHVHGPQRPRYPNLPQPTYAHAFSKHRLQQRRAEGPFDLEASNVCFVLLIEAQGGTNALTLGAQLGQGWHHMEGRSPDTLNILPRAALSLGIFHVLLNIL